MMTYSPSTLESCQSCCGFTIGINHYDKLQPLSYAQEDAQAFQTALLAKVGSRPHHHWLLTDTSPLFADQPTRPTKDNILCGLDQALAQLPEDAWFWFFFSGYGMNDAGQDYLLPIDAEPNNIVETGISLQFLFERLRVNHPLHTVVCLDINRSPARHAGTVLGAQTIALAQQLGISLFLSCQPEEFSHESTALRQGFFTATLLAALQDPHCSTLATLSQYLDQQLPKLNDHHFTPLQHPVSLIAPDMAGKPLFLMPKSVLSGTSTTAISPPPELEVTTPGMTFSSALASPNGHDSNGQPIGQPMGQPIVQGSRIDSAQPVTSVYDFSLPDSRAQATLRTYQSVNRELANGNGSTAVLPPETVPVSSQDPSRMTPFVDNSHSQASSSVGPTISKDGTSREPSDFALHSPSSNVMNSADMKPGQPPQDNTVDPANAESLEKSNFWPKMLVFGTITLTVLLLGVLWTNRSRFFMKPRPSTNQLTPPASPALPTQPYRVAGMPSPVPTLATPKDPALQPSFQALQNNQPAQALELLSQVPPTQQKTQEFTTLRQQAQYQANQAVLEVARTKIGDSQASRFSEAIKQAQTIAPTDPLYAQAQADIERWSQVILNLAEGRAMQGNYESAIAAANLVPASNSTTYQQAQRLLQDWKGKVQIKQRNQMLLQQAKAKTAPWQASSYNQAIGIASKIPQGQPFYAEAQLQIKDWSQRIVTIARARAAERQLSQAIQTAKLVPATTAAYATAQQDIAVWSQQIFQVAKGEAAKGQFQKAVLIANHIPSTTPIYGEVKQAIASWQSNKPAPN